MLRSLFTTNACAALFASAFALFAWGCQSHPELRVTTNAQPGETAPLTNAEIEAVIATGIGEMRMCFSSLLVNPHGPRGVLTLQWVVEGSGAVSGVTSTQSDFGPRETSTLLECLLPRVRALPFPKTRGAKALRITYPFVVR